MTEVLVPYVPVGIGIALGTVALLLAWRTRVVRGRAPARPRPAPAPAPVSGRRHWVATGAVALCVGLMWVLGLVRAPEPLTVAPGLVALALALWLALRAADYEPET